MFAVWKRGLGYFGRKGFYWGCLGERLGRKCGVMEGVILLVR